MNKIVAIVPAAGCGRRVGTKTNKQFLKLKGVPVSIFTMRRLSEISEIDGIFPVIRPDEILLFERKILQFPVGKILGVIPGGPERQDSVFNALNALRETRPEIVLIHDGVRPFFELKCVTACISAAREHGGAAVGLRAVDTIRQGRQGVFGKTLLRDEIYQMQTPQAFRFGELLSAYEEIRKQGLKITDDVQAFEFSGRVTAIVEGSRYNFKITTLEDMMLARKMINHVEI
ncbi:MAG: 2-C-methyl-D-erythritol 4-phosphate cytidylyltransferase [Candidatus Wallbacteria bacterium]|nr:2-C-methyl-D-erythritol 4-phosphate cytidylyltransferase [Candidatus Wallbacteria bacterium]